MTRWLTALVGAIVLAVVTVALAGSGGRGPEAPIGQRPVRVVATTNFLADMAREIGGDRVQVTSLMGPGVDPHSYKASASDVATLRDGDLLLYVGLNLEGRMGDWFEEMARRTTVVAVTDDIPRTALRRSPAHPDQVDPHVWLDTGLWSSSAEVIARALADVDPAGATGYRRRGARYAARLSALDREVRATLARIPGRERVLVTSHDAFGYFGRAYGFEVAGIQGTSTVTQATTDDIERVSDLVASRGIRAIFIESSISPQTIHAVREASARKGQPVEIGAELYADSAGGAGTAGDSYIGMIRANAQRIAGGLAGR